MHLVIKAPFQDDTVLHGDGLDEDRLSFDNEGNVNLGYLLSPAEDRVRVVQINGKYVEDWQRFIPGDDDRVEVIVGAGPQLIPMIIMMVISIILNIVMQLLAP